MPATTRHHPADHQEASRWVGTALPDLRLPATPDGRLGLRELSAERLVLYVYPRIGTPGRPDPAGWSTVPGARGCTRQSCAFRDAAGEFAALGVQLAGLAAQPHREQQEAAERLALPFPLLADPLLRLGRALNLPVFQLAGARFYRRLTLICQAGVIVHVLYPVADPGRNAEDALRWLRGSVGAAEQ